MKEYTNKAHHGSLYSIRYIAILLHGVHEGVWSASWGIRDLGAQDHGFRLCSPSRLLSGVILLGFKV